MKRTIAAASLGVMVWTAAAAAHHAFSAEFDQDKPVRLEGALTNAEWTNPHAWIYIDVKGEDGKAVNWAIEMGPPNALLRRGWKKSSMQIGMILKVEGFAAKNGKEFANATNITFPDGTKIFAGTDEPPKIVRGYGTSILNSAPKSIVRSLSRAAHLSSVRRSRRTTPSKSVRPFTTTVTARSRSN
jgi:hypothetical protein